MQHALQNEEVMFLNMLQRSHSPPVLASRVCIVQLTSSCLVLAALPAEA